MEVKTNTQDLLIIDDRPYIKQILLVAIGLAGFSLFLGSVKEYGIQAWYRFTYVAAIVMAIGGTFGFLYFTKTVRMVFDRVKKTFSIIHVQPVKSQMAQTIPLEEIQNVLIEKKVQKKSGRSMYRLALRRAGDSIIVPNHQFKPDYHTQEQMAKFIQKFLAVGD
ncbi:MAG: hypothetical protein KDD99_15780 [Bacteroidetes bacterium]|nr:hypothetical protein [Bacteroidota bacterium]